jgi:uncharacterized protein
MFGFGASVFISRAKELNRNSKALFARRVTFLFAFGLIHCLFFWFGDILTEYAVAGYILLLFSNKKGTSLAFWGIILGAIIPLAFKILQSILSADTPYILTNLGNLTLDAYSSGSYRRIINVNVINIQTFSFYIWFMLIAAIGRILIGYWIGQTGRLHQLEYHRDFFKKVMKVSAWIGFPVMLIVTATRILMDTKVLESGSEWDWITYLSDGSSLAIGIFYGIIFAFLYQQKKWKKRLSVFKEMGRMALTNYLLQTVINIFIFNGFGFGLAGKTGPSIYVLWFIILITLQIILSRWWLRRFHFGPFEWLWRSLTYKKLQPMKIRYKT